MPPKEKLSEFARGFIARTAEARASRNLSQQALADLLKIPQDRYKHYEIRTPLPHEFVIPFCRITDIDPWELFGASRPPANVTVLPAREGGRARKGKAHPRDRLRSTG